MQADDEAFQLRLVLHAGGGLHAAVHIDELRAARAQRLADILRAEAAREDPEILRVRGLRAPGRAAELIFDEAQRPAKLLQSGWTIEYRDYFADREPALPRKVFATKGKHRVRLFVEDWQLQ